MPFTVKVYVDHNELSASAKTAKEAFAKAVEWRVINQFQEISICDDVSTYSVEEFALMMAKFGDQ